MPSRTVSARRNQRPENHTSATQIRNVLHTQNRVKKKHTTKTLASAQPRGTKPQKGAHALHSGTHNQLLHQLGKTADPGRPRRPHLMQPQNKAPRPPGELSLPSPRRQVRRSQKWRCQTAPSGTPNGSVAFYTDISAQWQSNGYSGGGEIVCYMRPSIFPLKFNVFFSFVTLSPPLEASLNCWSGLPTSNTLKKMWHLHNCI